MNGADYLYSLPLILIALWVFFILVLVCIIRWVIRVNPRVELLKKILAELKQINTEAHNKQSARDLALLEYQKQEELKEIKDAKKLEKIKPLPTKVCYGCKRAILFGEPVYLFKNRQLCSKCNDEWRKKAGLDASASTLPK